ncbi:hypothetical protein GPECTOR_67g272 [Gonium pectorale]|uniref:Uncharacterized protein n=1 Tax=Gonium pectorale TaxID=33097 RepID=A0A150G3H4_GONPE|nr:hypothetical protein GPECTOR_67g272 [Gonium pectorale]|eukprot:KXZ44432.1 hypothetical protein GPECTOR_67g272 [Gonium pectorale]
MLDYNTCQCFFVGVGLLAGGIGVLVGAPKTRARKIDRINAAVAAWDNPTAPTGWRQFQQFNGTVSVSPPASQAGNPACVAAAKTLVLLAAACPTDVYREEGGRFQAVKQLSYCASVDFNTMALCNMEVTFQVLNSGNSTPSALVKVPSPVYPNAGNVIINTRYIEGVHKCGGGKNCDLVRCNNKCSSEFGGTYSCTKRQCDTIRAYVENVAIKVYYKPGTTPFIADTANPSMGPASAGANVLPSGYWWTRNGVNGGQIKGAMWTYEGLTYPNQPVYVVLQVRSSADPWLAYLAETSGWGAFGISKGAIIGIGTALIVVGSVIIAAVILFGLCLCWGKSLAKRQPLERPRGCIAGIAWSWGRSSLPPSQTTNAYAVPMGQPAPGAGYQYSPATGAYQYPPAYGAGGAVPASGYAYPPPPADGQQSGAYGAPYYSQQPGAGPSQPYGAAPAEGYPYGQPPPAKA